MFVAHFPSWEGGSSWFCHLQSTDCDLWGSVGKNLETGQTSRISRPTLASFCEWLWQLRNSEDFVMNTWRIVVVANYWWPSKTWSASIVAGVFPLRYCGWLVEWFFLCFPEDVEGKQLVTSSWTHVTLSRSSSGPKFRADWL